MGGEYTEHTIRHQDDIDVVSSKTLGHFGFKSWCCRNRCYTGNSMGNSKTKFVAWVGIEAGGASVVILAV
ncbi:hypothetical protein SLA2020_318450 [Shorea laevis]